MEPHWEFRDTQVFEHSRRVVRAGHAARLQPLQLKLLLYLVERKGEVATKEALMELLWKGHPSVDDHRLQTLVSDVRRIVGKDLVETIPGRGYRWSVLAKHIDPAAEASLPGMAKCCMPALPQPQIVRWRPLDGGPAGISIDGPEGLSIGWEDILKVEIEEKLLNQLGRLIALGSKTELLDFHGRKHWCVRIISPEHKNLRVWFGSDPERNWVFDGLIRVGSVEDDYCATVWQIFQRYSDGSYRLIWAKY